MSRPSSSFAGRRATRARGAIFIAALGITVVLSALVLVFAQSMRTEAMTAANRLAFKQADALEQGAERWVMAQVEGGAGDASTVCATPAEALPVGDGYFWVIRPSQDDVTQFDFGITDEASKINLNAHQADPATLTTQLLSMSAMTEEAADSIIDWRDSDETPGASGAESSYYSSLAESYVAKNGAYETVDELFLVAGITPELMYGVDKNRNGVIETSESANANKGTTFGSDETSQRGIAPYLTVWIPTASTTTTSATSTTSTTTKLNVNATGNQARTQRINMMTAAGIEASRVQTIANGWNGQFVDLDAFQTTVFKTLSEWQLVADKVGIGPRNQATISAVGLVNPGTALKPVLIALGLSDDDATRLVSFRTGADLSNFSWLFDSGITKSTINRALTNMTSKSSFYSADIVAVDRTSRAFKRVRIVVDGSATPSKIVYRKELSDLGWPLPAEIRTAMRSGQAPPTGYSSTNVNKGSTSGVKSGLH